MLSTSERFIVNASWLIKLRWVAAVGQLLTIATVVFAFQIAIPMLWALLTIILVTAVSNLVLSIMFGRWIRSDQRRRLPWDQILGIVMVMDMLSLTALLFASGGANNPFALFFFVNLSLCAVVLKRTWAWSLNVLSIVCFGLLLFDHHQLEQLDFGMRMLPIRQTSQFSLSQLGLFVAFLTCSSVIVYFMTRLTDELNKQQNDLRLAQQKQSRSERVEALGTLAAGAAHELATPLATIAVVARDVEHAFEQHPPQFPGANEVIEDVHLIRSQLDRCRKILDRMASHAGDSDGESIQSVPMRTLIDEVLDEIPRNDRLRLNLEDPLAASTIDVPFDSICQSLRGLVQNALDASRNAGTAISIDIQLRDNTWQWRISDVGEGMSPFVLDRISEPFFTTKPAGQGMGLGLFLARNVVQRLGGQIEFQSEPNKGTIVTVTLPKQQLPGIKSESESIRM